jgi:hypothetical protein
LHFLEGGFFVVNSEGALIKAKFIFFRVSPDEEKILLQLAARSGMNRSEYIRFLIRQAVDRAGLSAGLADAFGKLPVRGKKK